MINITCTHWDGEKEICRIYYAKPNTCNGCMAYHKCVERERVNAEKDVEQ